MAAKKTSELIPLVPPAVSNPDQPASCVNIRHRYELRCVGPISCQYPSQHIIVQKVKKRKHDKLWLHELLQRPISGQSAAVTGINLLI